MGDTSPRSRYAAGTHPRSVPRGVPPVPKRLPSTRVRRPDEEILIDAVALAHSGRTGVEVEVAEWAVAVYARLTQVRRAKLDAEEALGKLLSKRRPV